MDSLGQRDALASRLHSASFKLLRIVRSEEIVDGLTGPRLSALAMIAQIGPVAMADLAKAEQVRAPTMTRLVDALVAEALVERIPDVADRRLVRVAITEKGIAILKAGREPRLRALGRRLQRLGDSEMRALVRGVELIERVIKP